MSGKVKLLVGIGIGYVLGTRAGRERYGQMKAKAQAAWQDPRTQEKVHQAAQTVKETAQETMHRSGSEG